MRRQAFVAVPCGTKPNHRGTRTDFHAVKNIVVKRFEEFRS